MTFSRLMGVVLALLLPAGAMAAAPATKPAPDLREIARQAYVWGYPSVDLYSILVGQGLDPSSPEYLGPANQVHPIRKVATPEDTLVIAPNVDTPYAYAWLDLRAGPVVVVVPPFEPDRYVSLQLFDTYTWILGYVSPRTHGNRGARVLVAGPGWNGPTPEGIDTVFRSPTSLALGMFRTQMRTAGDLAGVHAVQDGMKVEAVGGRTATPGSFPTRVQPVNLRESPTDQDFFKVLAWMMQFMPTLPEEAGMRQRFASIGLHDGHFDPPAGAREAIAAGMADGLAEMRKRAGEIRSSAELFGSRQFLGDDYLTRATGAMLGILGNSAEEYLGIGWQGDANGQPFNGSRRYSVRFAPGQLPPVGAFWSITVYNEQRLLHANPLDRHVINSVMLPTLQRDADGGITLYMQADEPASGSSNWLPVPKGPFLLTFRSYLPGEAIRSGEWRAPPVVPAD